MRYPSGYGIVFKKVLCDPNITREVKALYALIAAYTGNDEVCWPSIKKISEYLASSEQSIRNWMKELSDAGWVEIERSNGRKSNRYRLIIPSTPVEGSTDKTYQPSTPVEGKPSTPVDPTINITNNNRSVSPSRPPIPKIDPDFEEKVWMGDLEPWERHWGDIYPDVNVEREMFSAMEYAIAHPEKQYKKWFAFLSNWMRNAQGYAERRNHVG
jgi:hypothetical protein